MDRELNLSNQILYKLGSIESQVVSVRDDIDKVVKRLEERIEDDKADNIRSIVAVKEQLAKEHAELTGRVSRNETLLKSLALWKDAWVTRTTYTLAIFGVVWTLFSEVIVGFIKGLFHV